jgi:RNA polymerase sigma-70 factor (ECF subfamily)
LKVEGPDDRELMRRFQERGDPGAFETLFHRHRTGLFRFLVRLSGNPTVAEEVSQQTWLQLIELAEQRRYRPRASFRTALYSLARNRWVDDHLRRKEATHAVPLDDPRAAIEELPAQDDDLGEALIRKQNEVAVSEAVAALPSDQREVVALWMQGFELVDVARITGARWHTVVSRKRYALEKLRRTLAVHSGEPR